MKTSRKQKAEIYEAARLALSTQHKDSIEYGSRVFYPNTNGKDEMSALERNAQSIFKAIDNAPDFAIHNVIADLRGRFRSIYRFVHDELYDDKGEVPEESLFNDTEQAMNFLYSSMMAVTKEYLFGLEEEVDPISDLVDFQFAKDHEDEMVEMLEE